MSSYYEKFLATGEVKCIDEEIPFEIPKGWEWCRLGELISYQNGYAYTSSELNKEGKGLPVIKSGNLMTYEVVLKPNNDYVENPSTKMLASAIKKGDLLMCLSSQSDNPEPLGKTAIYKVNNTALLNQRVLKMRPWLEDMLEYMYYAINSEYFHYTVSHQGGGSAQANLKLGYVLSMLIPLAPLKEEIRIVDKINKIIPLVHQYETTFLKQKKLNSELNDRLKSAILQEAIQGKLVPQIASEGTAHELLEQIKTEKQKLVKEGKLKKSALSNSVIYKGDDNKYYEQVGKQCYDITDQIPFEIPSSWQWCRLSNVIQLLSGRDLAPDCYNSENCGIPYITGASNFRNGELLINRWTNKPVTISHKNNLLITCKGTIGELAFNTIGDVHVARQIMSISGIIVELNYIKYFLQTIITSLERQANSMIPGISRETLLSSLLPLPPYQEQERIAQRINALFQLLK